MFFFSPVPFTRSAVALIVFAAWGKVSGQSPAFHLDPAKVMGPNACAQCHTDETAAWQLTHHSTEFSNIYRLPQAQEISKKMDVKLMNREGICLKCHFTVQSDPTAAGAPKAIAGISCESCHGAARDWINIHNNLKLPNNIAQATAAGMIPPTDYYALAANCFSCHTVPEQKLVNVGGHVAGSDFELVSWSQGEVRHNFLQDDGKEGKTNKPASQNRLRMLYVVGRCVDLEYGLRGTAKATEAANYGKALAWRAFNARKNVQAIFDATKLPEIKAILDASGTDADLKINNAAVLNAAADKVSPLIKQFSSANDGSKLAAVDALIPPASKYVGTVCKP